MPRFDAKDGSWFFEIERDGCVVHSCVGRGENRKVKAKTYATEDEARFAEGKLLTEHRRHQHPPMLETVACHHLPLPAPPPPGSALLVDAYFAAGDDRFLDEVLRLTSAGKVASLAVGWYADQRPWARRMLLAYIDDGCDRPEHKGLVKQLYKAAEYVGDDEALGHFLVAFDGLGRTLLVKASRWGDYQELRADPSVPERLERYGRKEASPRLSRVSRRYFARRAARYFRQLGHKDLARYGKAIRQALPLYRDESLASPGQLLGAWGLLQALYRYSPALTVESRGFTLKGTLADLAPAPRFPEAWRGVAPELLAMVLAARSRTVRGFTLRWLRDHEATALAALPFAKVQPLVLSAHEEVAALGVDLLKGPGVGGELASLRIVEWLELLAIPHLDLLPAICELVERHVAPVRIGLAQCVALATGAAAPVARLGLTWARGKKVDTAADLALLIKLTRAPVAAVRDEAAAWVSQVVTGHRLATPELLRDLCDAPHADARAHALAAVSATGATTDKLAPPTLWFALTESPYPDVREVVLANAARWRAEAPKATLRHVWTSAVLAVHGGGEAKRRVPRAIAERIATHPDEAAELLPILRLALRSVRPPERATALAALVGAVHASATLRALAAEIIPELTVTAEVAS